MSDAPVLLVTGCSSGIGLAVAAEMRSRGWRVIPTARKAEDLEMLRGLGYSPLELDLNDSAAIQRVPEAVGGRIDGLVNNAGFGQPGALEDLTRGAMRRQFETNVFGLQELSNAVLPGMIARGSGRIVHISSVVGRIALPFLGIYSASKFAVEALADAQRVELSGTGVRISLVEPGPIITRFSVNAAGMSADGLRRGGSRFEALYASELSRRRESPGPKAFALPPEAVARAVAHALTSRRPRIRYTVTLPAKLGSFLRRAAPASWIDAILRGELRRRRP